MIMKIPEGHQTVMPYLILKDGKGFLSFVREVFNGRITHEDYHEDGLLRHAEIQVGGNTLMVATARPEWPAQPAGMFIYVENADETYKKALEHGATSVMEPADQHYGRSSGVVDANDNTWWITSL
jgi:uncharacterized glyoxalase superfamily protein PhnB